MYRFLGVYSFKDNLINCFCKISWTARQKYFLIQKIFIKSNLIVLCEHKSKNAQHLSIQFLITARGSKTQLDQSVLLSQLYCKNVFWVYQLYYHPIFDINASLTEVSEHLLKTYFLQKSRISRCMRWENKLVLEGVEPAEELLSIAPLKVHEFISCKAQRQYKFLSLEDVSSIT